MYNYVIIKVDFKARSITKDKEAHFITIKGASLTGRHNHQKLHVPNDLIQYIKSKVRTKVELEKSIWL